MIGRKRREALATLYEETEDLIAWSLELRGQAQQSSAAMLTQATRSPAAISHRKQIGPQYQTPNTPMSLSSSSTAGLEALQSARKAPASEHEASKPASQRSVVGHGYAHASQERMKAVIGELNPADVSGILELGSKGGRPAVPRMQTEQRPTARSLLEELGL